MKETLATVGGLCNPIEVPTAKRPPPTGNRYSRGTSLTPFGRLLREAIAGSRFKNRSEFLKEVGISHSAMYAYEIGQRVPSAETLKRVAEFLRIPVSYFTGEKLRRRPAWRDAEEWILIAEAAERAAAIEENAISEARELLAAADATQLAVAIANLRTRVEEFDKVANDAKIVRAMESADEAVRLHAANGQLLRFRRNYHELRMAIRAMADAVEPIALGLEHLEVEEARRSTRGDSK